MQGRNTDRERVRRRRDKLRAAGLRPVQLWVPDTRAPEFATECARQARLIRAAEADDALADDALADAEAWHEASDTTGWTA